MFIFGIYLPPYQARVISYLYNFLSGPVFISLPPGGTVSNGRAPSFPPLNLYTTRLVFIALHNISQYLLLTHTSGIISYLKISFTFYLSIYTYVFFLLRFQNLDLYLENHRSCLLLCKQLSIESEHAHYVISLKALQLLLSFIYIPDLIIL